MATKRKNPLFDTKSKEESSTLERGNNTTSHLEDTSFCPVCNTKMQEIKANGIPSYICFDHRVNLPIKD